MTISSAVTPSLILDRSKLLHNLDQMDRRARQLGVDLRPHLKTTKSVPIAQLATANNRGGVTVSTLREAAYFLEAGFTDILYAVGIVPSKMDQVALLMRHGAEITIVLDNPDAAHAVAAYGQEHSLSFNVLIELDCDNHRSGAEPASGEVLAMAKFLSTAQGVRFGGIMTHAGGAYGCQSVDEIVAMAEQERYAAVSTAAMLRAAGLAVPVVSVGSTPTALVVSSLEGVTEFRPGNYMLKDMSMVELGVATHVEVAASVLTTVIGHNPRRGMLITDAGGLALSKDLGLDRNGQPRSYGAVCTAAGDLIDDLHVADVNQEHGMILSRIGRDLSAIAIGTLLRILPNHICMTAAAYDRYILTQPEADGALEWARCNGW